MKSKHKKVTLIIPCYNESKSLETLISKCCHKDLIKNVEIILVDNGSTDNTNILFNKILKDIEHINFITVTENKGYGFGILSGLKEAKTQYVGWTHADLQTDPKDIISALPILEENNENIFFKGTRYNRSFFDNFFTIGMSIFETIIFGYFFWDINAQPTIFHKNFLLKMQNPPHDYSLDLYAYYLAKKNKMLIQRFPVKFSDRLFGKSHWNLDYKSKLKFIIRTINYSLKLKRKF